MWRARCSPGAKRCVRRVSRASSNRTTAASRCRKPPRRGTRLRSRIRRNRRLWRRSPTRFRITDGAIAPADAAQLAPRLARARVEIVLRPERFLFRPLQLPRRAAEFLEAIIRSQIDRLTPWSPAEAAFGFLPEPGAASERMNVTIAATARALLSPFVEAVRGLGVETVSISTPAPDGGGATIKVLEQKIEGAVEAQRLRRGLATLIARARSSSPSHPSRSRVSLEANWRRGGTRSIAASPSGAPRCIRAAMRTARRRWRCSRKSTRPPRASSSTRSFRAFFPTTPI